ncbi:hypothetical protein D822_01579 [Streptococcus ratti FA-1 = DSM 20564]|uniref:hypothetical protein n=1 Tax=Streptococcus ratti TaxID=1341 RepID=UPI0002BF29EB|nr:hypothetical protein [Streptococcus ratti]EMP71310.1 hypothetical protein D822_01579 [Streptococcus ratti FA-1 = DSM 20564]
MNAVTLNSMAFDHLETVVEDYLAGVEGEGLGAAIDLGITEGIAGVATGFSAKSKGLLIPGLGELTTTGGMIIGGTVGFIHGLPEDGICDKWSR